MGDVMNIKLSAQANMQYMFYENQVKRPIPKTYTNTARMVFPINDFKSRVIKAWKSNNQGRAQITVIYGGPFSASD